jgi:NTP pyrophosphatase (non-canonical NTP hydrolase)
MCVKKYQEETKRTLKPSDDNNYVLFELLLGLSGEVGELVNLVKKKELHGHDIQTSKISEEIGDCMWYISNICNQQGLDLSQILYDNIEKLNKRYPKGYTKEDSIRRPDAMER